MKNLRFLLLLIVVGCGPQYETKYYRAISPDTKDTAFLKLFTSENVFYGDYQIKYGDKSSDSGAITGLIAGDTLLGKFSYLSRGNVRSVDPIVFLKDEENLKLGSGTAGTYMGFHVYQAGSILFKDSLFQFYPIESFEKTNRDTR